MNTTPWLRHQATMNEMGQAVCQRCHIALPTLLPAFLTFCSKDDRFFCGDIPAAKDCTP